LLLFRTTWKAFVTVLIHDADIRLLERIPQRSRSPIGWGQVYRKHRRERCYYYRQRKTWNGSAYDDKSEYDSLLLAAWQDFKRSRELQSRSTQKRFCNSVVIEQRSGSGCAAAITSDILNSISNNVSEMQY
jgi:hypothetical protein